jgi:predicted DNA-binding transcriptional regulator AlpA
MKTPSAPKRHANTNTMDLPLFLAPQVAEITGLSEKAINRRIHDGMPTS